MQIHKRDIIDALRARGQDDRADWVDRTLPDIVDSRRNDGLLKLLNLDLSTLPAVEQPTKG
ncbi:hypothetical protein Ais01nite_18700 [Asanoa ishikariensis]|uniref:Uncharacterized protein n=1 Tax=Asanoa ishikariensis TaxID=137265 RepID=A0A1H3UD24_9ACTN|nr:hypothetical protein [Asanoa ishikariensis]GIF63835.1 hypothetical protein Ais01nite_18700 [Asanoa ishikariensis]SDZ60197.1 hypothetical protein SAMN05421684_7004 [Asanoa ishikariensis]